MGIACDINGILIRRLRRNWMARRRASHGHLNRVILFIWRARKPDAAAPGSRTCTVACDESKEDAMPCFLPNLALLDT